MLKQNGGAGNRGKSFLSIPNSRGHTWSTLRKGREEQVKIMWPEV